MPFIVPRGGGNAVIIGENTLREKLGIDVMAQAHVSVLKAYGRQDGAGLELTARAVGEPTAGAVVRAAMAVTVFGPGCDAPGDLDDDVTLTPVFQKTHDVPGFRDGDAGSCGRVGDGGR